MDDSSGILADATSYVKALFADDCSGHDVYHTLRVYNMAIHLAQIEHADAFITGLGALLHDVDDRKLSPQTHQDNGNAMRFMRRHGLNDALMAQICGIISAVSFAGRDSVTPQTIEGKCVQDADRLDAIGAIGIARAFAYGGSRGRPLYDPAVPPRPDMTAQEYAAGTPSTINHFYEKLLLLKSSLHTPTAQAIARSRDAFMRGFLEQFFAEWDATR